MNRTFASKMVLSIGQKMRDLISKGLPYQSGFHDPLWLAMMKVKMAIHAQLLTSLLQDFFNAEDPILLASDANQKMQALYQELWNSYYECTMRPHSYTFNTFWENLVSYHNIPKEELDEYEHAKIQTCILWKTLGFLFRFGQESDESAYVIRKDVDFIEGAFNRGCSNTLLDRAFSLMSSDDYFPTIFFDWKDNPLPAVLKPECSTYEFQKKKPRIGRFQYGNKTLGDVWQDYTLISNLNKEAPKTAVLLHNAEHELAQTLGELTETYISVIELFAQERDLKGKVWDDAILTDEQCQKIDKNMAIIEEVVKIFSNKNDDMKNLQKTVNRIDKNVKNMGANLDKTTQNNMNIEKINDLIANRDVDTEKVYSADKIEAARERIGEKLANNPIVIPTRKQKAQFLDCRWIFPCTATTKTYKPSPETYINRWCEACENEDLMFWDALTLKNGLYLLLDGELIKATTYDRNVSRKIRNGLLRDPISSFQNK